MSWRLASWSQTSEPHSASPEDPSDPGKLAARASPRITRLKGATSQSAAISTDAPVHRQRDWAGDCPPYHALLKPGAPALAARVQVVSLEGPRTARVSPGARRAPSPGAPSEDEARRAAGLTVLQWLRPLHERLSGLFTPDTLLRWHRELVRRKWDGPHRIGLCVFRGARATIGLLELPSMAGRTPHVTAPLSPSYVRSDASAAAFACASVG